MVTLEILTNQYMIATFQ